MNLSVVLNTFFGSALIIILIFAECLLKYTGSRKNRKLFCIVLIIVFLSLIIDLVFFSLTSSKNINVFLISSRMVWPITAALMLYFYLFIMLRENRIDVLTGLGNRYSFFEFFNRLSRNKTGESWSVALIDINNFKSINNIYGHLEGDSALRNLSNIIKTCAKKSDFTARYGGDEFILVVKNENEINRLIAGIEYELGKLNSNSKKPYNIEISYAFDTFITDGTKPIDIFLNQISILMHKNNEEKRRASDTKTGERV